ncbi:MAG: hypothetical protein ACO25F_04955 [Erythrobacter sp.]
MRKLTLSLSAAALALGSASIAYADHHGGQHGGGHGPDANGDGIVTRAEHDTQVARMFERIDINRDGVINQADREARQDERFAKADTDGNGQISREEMKAAQAARADRMRERKGAMAQRGGEHGGPGGMGDRGGKRGKGAHGMMMLRAADTNGDKAVSRAEFEAAAAKRFANADTDNSGSVSAEERKAAREAMRAKMQERRSARQPG